MVLDESERKARTALARLEAGTLRGFRELQERFRG
jgi:F-type H+-transporting ATPase subunit epsilon